MNAENKHTKGEWTLRDCHDDTHTFDIVGNNKTIGTAWMYDKGKLSFDAYEQKANALLFAASKDMYEALKEVVKYMTMDSEGAIETQKKVFAALRKAEGKIG
jgi:hypothetical protein